MEPTSGAPSDGHPHRNSNPLEREVLLKGMSSEKHFSPPERQEYFFDIQPPALEATFLLQLLDRFVPLRSGP